MRSRIIAYLLSAVRCVGQTKLALSGAGGGGVNPPDVTRFNGGTDLASNSVGYIPSGNDSPFTVCWWLKMGSLTQATNGVMKNYDSGNTYFWFVAWWNPTASVTFAIGSFTGTNPDAGSEITPPDTNWHHMCYRKGSGAVATWDKFLDGTKTSINSAITFDILNTNPRSILHIGATATGAGIDAAIAHVIIAHEAISESNISSLYSSCADPTKMGLTSLQAWFKLYSAAPTLDSSGNGNTLTITGTTSNVGPAACAI